MKIKFIVNSIRSKEQNKISLEVKHNNKSTYKLEECPIGKLEFDFDAYQQTNIIEFFIKNKSGKFTVIKENKVIKDTAIIIEKIYCDNFDLFPKINLFSNYFTDENGMHRTNGYMGFNGKYVFKFRYPLSRHLVLCEYY